MLCVAGTLTGATPCRSGAVAALRRLAVGRRYSTLAVRGLMVYRLRQVGVVCRLRYPVRVLSTSSAGVSRDLVTLKLLGPWNT